MGMLDGKVVIVTGAGRKRGIGRDRATPRCGRRTRGGLGAAS